MREFKGTPGPWYKTGSVIRAVGGAERKIADVRVTDAEGEANAKLVVACPELLSLAKRWLALDGQWHPDRYESEKAQLLDDTRDLIAKATA